jgi:hypothetical protein
MIFNLNKFKKIFKKSNELIFLIFLILITVISTKFYNNNKIKITENYKNTINNIYFEKTIDYIFDGLSPRYKSIDHKISEGETFDKILKKYFIPDSEIIKIKNKLKNDFNLNNLKTNQIIKFTIDQSQNIKVINFLFPLSRTKKIQLTRILETNSFKKKQLLQI